MDKQSILNAIIRTAKANGGQALGINTFERETGIRRQDWRGIHWARWSEAIREAGFSPNTIQQPHASEAMLEKLADLAHRLGHFPTTDERKIARRSDINFPSSNTFMRFGTTQQLKTDLGIFCTKKGGLDDVVAMCSEFSQENDNLTEDPDTKSHNVKFGLVYLKKSGKFYKIGRTNDSMRRHRELAIQVPEALEIVHEIKTDDPSGVEAYWHQRFREKRKNGEWFDLTRQDVMAFKRWKRIF